MLRAAPIGTILGVLPGAGATIASFVAYGVETRVAKDRSRFGKGAIEGITAPETANNAAAQAGFIPTLSLGIPGDAVMALMLGALLDPRGQSRAAPDHRASGNLLGPAGQFLGRQPDAACDEHPPNRPVGQDSINPVQVPLSRGADAGLRRGLQRQQQRLRLAWSCSSSRPSDTACRWPRLSPAPMLLGIVLGPMMEENFRRALLLSRGDVTVFIDRPVCLTLLVLGLLLLFAPLLRKGFGRLRRERAARWTGTVE